MPFCSKCGFDVEETDNFCAKCGFKLKPKKKINPKSRKSFWQIFLSNIKHAFIDSEEKLTTGRKIINIILVIAIVGVILSFLWPVFDSIRLSFTTDVNPLNQHGECKFNLDARDITIHNAVFNLTSLTMIITMENTASEAVTLQNLAKTYEFRFDNQGETEDEALLQIIPPGRTINVKFDVREEPYIIGFDINQCEKLKISSWETVE